MVVLVYCLAIRGYAVPVSSSSTIYTRPEAKNVANLVKGRVLLLLLHQGMTQREATDILGQSSAWWRERSLDAWYFAPLGLTLCFDNDMRLVSYCCDHVVIEASPIDSAIDRLGEYARAKFVKGCPTYKVIWMFDGPLGRYRPVENGAGR